mmetsp:Transcript_17541/g.19729  ORF Transcript_17541/g.19729 Transcript_17541/m.19729 type:complete len:104 (+) Transcript_17541:384-695(+)
MFGLKFSEEELIVHHKLLKVALKQMNTIFLSKTKYLTGDEISIADLISFCELLQLRYIKYDLSKYPNVEAWYNRIFEIKEVQKVSSRILSFIEKYHKKLEAKI